MNAVVRNALVSIECYNRDLRWEMITPQIALEYLGMNTHNRIVRDGLVGKYAREMASGNFIRNGDSVRFDINGTLLDGQHRLLAIVSSGRPQPVVVVRGLPPEAMLTIDSGAKRTNGDRISLMGVENGNAVAASINVLKILATGNQRGDMTGPECRLVLDRHPGIEDSVKLCMPTSKIVTPSVLGALHYAATYIGKDRLANEFVETLRTGMCDHERDPARMLREFFIKHKNAKRSSDEQSRTFKIEYLLLAWENKLKGKFTNVKRKPADDEDRLKLEGWEIGMLM